jgi:hypothetical protein
VGVERIGLLTEAAWVAVAMGGIRRCLDLAATGPYGGSSGEKEKTTSRRNREPTQPPVQARWKKSGVLGLGFNPKWHIQEKQQENKKGATRSVAQEA